MSQLVKLLVIIIASSALYVSYVSAVGKPKTDMGFFISSILGVVIWLVIKNIWMGVKDR